VPDPKRVYSDDEVKAILSRAIDRQRASSPEGLSHEDLLAVARDAGIAPEAIEAAAADITVRSDTAADELAIRKERASDFRIHLLTYIPIIAFLVFVNAMTTRYPWVLWPAVAWGLALVLHARFAVFPSDVEIAHDAAHLAERRRRAEEKRRRTEDKSRRSSSRSDIQQGARELGQAVERGVAVILTETAKRIHEEIGPVAETRGRRVRVEDAKAGADGDEDEDDGEGNRKEERRTRR